MPETWMRLTVHTNAANIDAVSAYLIERGSSGVVVKRHAVEAYFPKSLTASSFRKTIGRYLTDRALTHRRGKRPHAEWRRVKQENWQHTWKRFIKSSRIGKTLWVTPPWLTAPRLRHRQVITIEPGMAFGTGTHATTRGCLEFIEVAAALLPAARFTALDVGTGSGILAIALTKLGAGTVWAIDSDPVAREVARDNFLTNHVAEKIHLSPARLSGIRKRFTVVVANLTAETIVELADAMQKLVAPKGYLILSGILHPKAAIVARCFAARFRVMKRKRSREWATLLLRRK